MNPDPRLPHPDETRVHGQVAKPGHALAIGVAQSFYVPLAGTSQARFRVKADVALALAFFYLRPDGQTRYDASHPGAQNAVANTELVFEISPLFGEAWVEVEVTPGGTGVVTWFDVMY